MIWQDLSTAAMATGGFVLLFLFGGFLLFITLGNRAEARRRRARREAPAAEGDLAGPPEPAS